MARLFNMEIADVSFTLDGDESVRLQDPEAVYHPFIHKGCDVNQAIKIDMSLKLPEKMPETVGLEQIFDSGEAWSMFRDDRGYWVSLDLSGYNEPIWLAQISRDFTRATLFCGRELVSHYNGKVCVFNPVTYPLDQILLMYILAARGGLLVHAMGLISNDRGYLFPGKSGAGKSTMAQLFEQKGGFELLNDDRLVVRKSGDSFKLYGTPWPGDAGIAVNRSVGLSAIFFLNHSPVNRVEALGKREAVERLLSVISVPWYDKDVVPHMLASCEELLDQVPAYTLYFKPGKEVADLLDRWIIHTPPEPGDQNRCKGIS